jgi:hypothetical protein
MRVPGSFDGRKTACCAWRAVSEREKPDGRESGWAIRTGGRAPVPSGSGAHDASDEHSGAEVCAEHRPHLGAEQRTRAEDLGAPGDQMLGVLG